VSAVRPPVTPMLAKLARELPEDGYLYEPKWDGFRALAFRDGDDVDIRSRHDRPLARYFPELVAALRELPVRSVALDGEIVIATPGADLGTVMLRLHPAASRVERLARETPATFIVFDLLEHDGDDVRGRPFSERRTRLEPLISGSGRVQLSPVTSDRAVAKEWLEARHERIDGVIAKHPTLRYEPGKRVMVKVKLARSADCVVGGMRWLVDEPVVGALLLGLWDGASLRHVGVASAFTGARRRELYQELLPLATDLRGHPWARGFGLDGHPIGRLGGSASRWDPREMELDWIPLRPERVAEVAYDVVDSGRFRHPARFIRWRPDRDPRSCTFDQIA